MFKVMVVDDEAIARNNAVILLKDRGDIGEIVEAHSGTKAIELLAESFYNIVLLDIQMPGKTGLEVIENIPANTSVIFATAYQEHALEAFNLSAVDYILKPFDDERFHTSIDRALHKQKNVVLNENEALVSALGNIFKASSPEKHSKLVLRETGKIKLIDTDDIKFVKGAGNYVEIFLHDGKILLQRETLRAIEAKLDEQEFVRIHKSTILKTALISELRPTPKGDYAVILTTGDELMMSRRNKDKLRRWMV